MKAIIASAFALAAVSLFASVANAQTTAITDIVSPSIELSPTESLALGFQFTANNNISITQLGAFDDKGNGLAATHAVGLYSVATQSLLASTIVSSNSTLDGLFRYNDVKTVDLTAGQDYIVAAVYLKNTDAYLLSQKSYAVSADITFVKDLYTTATTPASIFPTETYGLPGYFSANFKYKSSPSAIPEPSVLALLLPVLGTAIIKRRRAK